MTPKAQATKAKINKTTSKLKTPSVSKDTKFKVMGMLLTLI
jgi:hypothetical protein